MRAPRLITQFPDLDAERAGDRFPQLLGARPGRGVVIDMGLIAIDFDRLGGCEVIIVPPGVLQNCRSLGRRTQ